jgi:RNA polymerase sporulation-specific sigma factor
LHIREKLYNENNKEPSISDIAKELDVPREELVMALDSIQETISLYDPVFQDGTDSLCVMDQIKDDNTNDTAWEQTMTLNHALDKLGSRERLIIDMRFFEGRTQMEVAEEIGISQAQVSRLEKNALKHMRKYV